ncbi:MAG: glucosaminidase domain-containing protein [Lutibacter sp.]
MRKIKKYFFVIVIFSLIVSCKSKKKLIHKQQKTKQTVQVVNNPEPSKTITKAPVKSNYKMATEVYISTYKDIAMEEMRVYKIPASITLAQGILESSSGNSLLTLKSNNHFGIKCHDNWFGGRVYYDDDHKGECFRVYKDPNNSFKDHSKFLAHRKRYAKLFKLRKDDYVGWAKGLSKAGYATDRRYPAKLIALIEKYDLSRFDEQVLGKKSKTENNINDYVVVKGDTLYSIAKRFGLSVSELKIINNLSSNDLRIGQKLLLTN